MLHLLRAAHKAEVLALALRACLSACGSWFLCKVEMHEEHLLKHHLCLQKFRLRGTTVFHTRRHMCIEAAELCGGAGRRLSQRAALATDGKLPTAAGGVRILQHAVLQDDIQEASCMHCSKIAGSKRHEGIRATDLFSSVYVI